MYWSKHVLSLTVVGALTALSGCTSHSSLPEATAHPSMTTNVNDYQYLIGPGDSLTIFVWRNPEISGQFIVRPDGKVTTSLVEDVDVAGKTPSMLARELEEVLRDAREHRVIAAHQVAQRAVERPQLVGDQLERVRHGLGRHLAHDDRERRRLRDRVVGDGLDLRADTGRATR